MDECEDEDGRSEKRHGDVLSHSVKRGLVICENYSLSVVSVRQTATIVEKQGAKTLLGYRRVLSCCGRSYRLLKPGLVGLTGHAYSDARRRRLCGRTLR